MTREDKQLLIKDLCARQPYGVKVSVGRDRMNDYIEPEMENYLTLYYINPQRLECIFKECWWTAYIGAIRPYLRSMSNMTEEERKEENRLWDIITKTRNDLHYLYTDFLLSRHFDYRGLIPIGLALEAHDNMYNNIKIE